VELWHGTADGPYEVVANAVDGDLSDATALALGDLDGDGLVDLAVGRGQNGALPDRILYGTGPGQWTLDTGALPEVASQTRGVAMIDIDGDGKDELLVASAAEPVRAFAEDGQREYVDRSFVLLPKSTPVDARQLSTGDWNGDCVDDVIIAAAATESWPRAGATLASEGALGAADASLIGDVDEDGTRDALLIGDGGLTWLRR
jgi:hypothetical protein